MNVGELSREILSRDNPAQVIAFSIGPGDVNSLAEGDVGDHGNFAVRG